MSRKSSNLQCYFGCVTDGPLHKFPNPQSVVHWENCNAQMERFNKWKAVLDSNSIGKGDSYIRNTLRLCYRHFEERYRLPSGLLTKNAVPKLQIGIKVALLQLAVGMDKTKNIANAVQEIHKAKAGGAQLIALPEFFNAPYGTKYFKDYAEEIPKGQTCEALKCAAKEAGVCLVGGTIPERFGDKFYNTCTVWDSTGTMIAKHRKVHLFDIDIPGKMTFKESDVLTAGDQITTFEYMSMKIGVGICYDIRFPEMAQVMAKMGCQMLVYPAAFNTTTGPRHWELLARARACDLQLWVALVSPARDASADYVAWGHSLLVDPWAGLVHQLGDGPGVLYADIDPKVVDEVRTQIPVRSQRRLDLYDTVKHE